MHRYVDREGKLTMTGVLQVLQLGPALSNLLILHSEKSYIETAIRIATMKRNESVLLKESVCQNKEKLFGRNALHKIVTEWRELFFNILTR